MVSYGYRTQILKQDIDPLKTSLTLLERARSGQSSIAWQEMVKIYTPFITKILLHFGLKNQELDEVLQAVYIKLWKGIQSYDLDMKRAKFRTWFSSLIRNAVMDEFRSQKRDQRNISLDSMEDKGFPEKCDDLETMIETEWQQYLVTTAIEKIKHDFSDNAMLVFDMSMQGHSSKEIEEKSGVKINSQYVLKNRIRTRLKQEIQNLRNDLENL